jgi:hypothetical protein
MPDGNAFGEHRLRATFGVSPAKNPKNAFPAGILASAGREIVLSYYDGDKSIAQSTLARLRFFVARAAEAVTVLLKLSDLSFLGKTPCFFIKMPVEPKIKKYIVCFFMQNYISDSLVMCSYTFFINCVLYK